MDVKTYRELRGMTLADCAEAWGVPYQSVAILSAKGNRSVPLKHCIRIAEVTMNDITLEDMGYAGITATKPLEPLLRDLNRQLNRVEVACEDNEGDTGSCTE